MLTVSEHARETGKPRRVCCIGNIVGLFFRSLPMMPTRVTDGVSRMVCGVRVHMGGSILCGLSSGGKRPCQHDCHHYKRLY